MAISKEQVGDAIEEAKNRGIPDSAGSLRSIIGSGSKSTIEKYKKEFLGEVTHTPSSIPAKLQKSFEATWAELVKKADDDAQAKAIGLIMAAEERAEQADIALMQAGEIIAKLETELSGERSAVASATDQVQHLHEQMMQYMYKFKSAESERDAVRQENESLMARIAELEKVVPACTVPTDTSEFLSYEEAVELHQEPAYPSELPF